MEEVNGRSEPSSKHNWKIFNMAPNPILVAPRMWIPPALVQGTGLPPRCSTGSKTMRNRAPMNISVRPSNSDNIHIPSIKALLTDTANHLNQFLRNPFSGVIEVQIASNEPKAPITLNRDYGLGQSKVLLSARDKYWCQYVFQFAHEFCHVLTDYYERLLANPNAWLHETICEIASIFALQRMAHQWCNNPTIPGQHGYAEQFQIYADDRLGRREVKLPTGMDLHGWLKSREKELRSADVTDDNQRLNQSLIAYILLPIFEKNPEGWNAITKFPTSTGELPEYLSDWHLSVDSDDKNFVAILSDALGHKVGN